MKKLITLLSTLAFAGFANAGVIVELGGAELGYTDDWVGSTTSLDNSNPDTEIDWANGVLLNTGYTTDANYYDTSDYIKVGANCSEDPECVGYQITDDGAHIAFQLSESPEHYIIKNAKNWGLFFNNALYNWAVVALDDLVGFNVGQDDLTISHVGQLGSVSVPEPATLGLFALGLVGLSAARRRKTT